MKTQRLVGKLLLFSAAVVLPAFTSCKKSEVSPISLKSVTCYVEQTESGYLPHIGFECQGNEALEIGTITKDENTMFPTVYEEYNICQINPSQNIATSLTSLNGNYKVLGTGVKGHTARSYKFSLSFTGNEDMGEVKVAGFGYANDFISATFDKVANAQSYGFYLQAYKDATPMPYILECNQFLCEPAGAGDTQKVTFAFNPRSYISSGITSFKVTPVAVNVVLVKKAGESITIDVE